jgi:hypothetical protein
MYLYVIIHPSIHKARNAFANAEPWVQFAEREQRSYLCVCLLRNQIPTKHDTGRCLFLLLLACLGMLLFILGATILLEDSTTLDTTTLLEYVNETILINGLEVPFGNLLLPTNCGSSAFSTPIKFTKT